MAPAAVVAVQEAAADSLPARLGRLLDRLGDLQKGLLSGAVSPAIPRDVARMLEALRPGVADGALAEIVAEVELRAAVELAKLPQVQGEPTVLIRLSSA